MKEIVKQAVKRDFTDVIVLNDDNGKPTGMHLIHLPNGPTVHFKMSRWVGRLPYVGSAR